MAGAKIEVHHEVVDGDATTWQLCFQDCTYHHDDGGTETGYRFIWRDPAGRLRAQRGQARIPDAATLRRLIDQAEAGGWLA